MLMRWPPGGNWIASAQDMRGRVYIIDQAGDLYYDSGNPDIGIYAVRGWEHLETYFAQRFQALGL